MSDNSTMKFIRLKNDLQGPVSHANMANRFRETDGASL